MRGERRGQSDTETSRSFATSPILRFPSEYLVLVLPQSLAFLAGQIVGKLLDLSPRGGTGEASVTPVPESHRFIQLRQSLQQRFPCKLLSLREASGLRPVAALLPRRAAG